MGEYISNETKGEPMEGRVYEGRPSFDTFELQFHFELSFLFIRKDL